MTDTPTPPDNALTRLLREYVCGQEQVSDVGPLFARIKAAQSNLAEPSRTTAPTARDEKQVRRVHWRLLTGMAATAAAILVLIGLAYSPVARADAAALVQNARRVHNLPVDRCYLVDVQKDAAPLDDSYPLLAQSRVTRLWTRGDRFWIESVNARRQWAWGRDERGAIWIALNPRKGVRFDDAEVPELMALTCDVCSLRLDTLLGDVLADFDLRRTSSPNGLSTDTVRAEPKPGRTHSFLQSVVLEIDPETRVIRRATLTRTVRGQRIATVTFSLLDTRPQDESRYRLEGHLREPYQVYSKAFEPQTRRKLLVREFGPRAADGMKDDPKD